MEADMWEYSWLWTCHVPWIKEMLESHSVEWIFWHGSVCVVVLAQRRFKLNVICSKNEDFCKPQTNEVTARLTCWQASDKEKDLSMSGIMPVKLKCLLPSTNQKEQVSYIEIFWFFLKDGEFVSKTINDLNINLDKFPASKVTQLTKKMESSKSTTRHIKAVASDTQVTQVNLMRHQRTDLPPSKSKWKQHSLQSK